MQGSMFITGQRLGPILLVFTGEELVVESPDQVPKEDLLADLKAELTKERGRESPVEENVNFLAGALNYFTGPEDLTTDSIENSEDV